MTELNAKYYKRYFGGGCIILGLYMLIEHIYSWGNLDFWDIIGHEWLGLIFFLAGLSLFVNFKKPPEGVLIKLKNDFMTQILFQKKK